MANALHEYERVRLKIPRLLVPCSLKLQNKYHPVYILYEELPFFSYCSHWKRERVSARRGAGVSRDRSVVSLSKKRTDILASTLRVSCRLILVRSAGRRR